MDEATAAADAISGGVLARAVEPAAGEAGHAHERTCLNGGTRLTGLYCHACGQQAHVHRTLTAFWHDLLHGVLHFEGKIWRTLPMLAWWPGDLTRRYVAGERARFVSPLALFLFSVFLTFAVFGWTGGPFGSVTDNVQIDGSRDIADAVVRADQKVAALEKRRVAVIAVGDPTISLDAELADEREGAAMMRLIQRRLYRSSADPRFGRSSRQFGLV